MAEFVTVGETMAVFVPQEHGPLRYNSAFRMRTAGAESNTAVGICKLGHEAAWLSALGQDELGQFVRNAVRAEGVDCTGVKMDPRHRTGLMLKEIRGGETSVYYYRENSAASHLQFSDLDQEILQGARILHLTGILPVISPEGKKLTEDLVHFAREQGILLSFDPNIRLRLWGRQDYRGWMKQVLQASDIVLMGLEEARQLYDTEDINAVIHELLYKGQAKYVAVKDGGNGAIAADHTKTIRIPPYPCSPVDTVGAGDAFNAGFLSGVLKQQELEICGQMGGIAGAMATETSGDIEGYPEREQLLRRLNGTGEIYR